MNLSRRSLLGTVAASVVPVSAAAMPETLSPRERLAAAVVELQAAAEAFDPTIKSWMVNIDSNDNLKCKIAIAALNW